MRVDSASWKAEVVAAIGEGFSQFVTLIGVDDGTVSVWLRMRNSAGEDRVLSAEATSGIDSLVALLPECAWYEREAAETFGIDFLGHDTAHLLLREGDGALMLKSTLLEARQVTPWPGEKEPGGATARRRQLPPGVRA